MEDDVGRGRGGGEVTVEETGVGKGSKVGAGEEEVGVGGGV